MKTRQREDTLFDVEAILAADKYGVVGQDSTLPWHHAGDFKRFKRLTMNHALLMGVPTFIGLVKNFTKPGQQVLPGRWIFVVGRPWSEDLTADLGNVTRIAPDAPKYNLEKCRDILMPHQKLFICGGARIYRDYLDYAEQVHFTLMHKYHQRDLATVNLQPKSMNLLGYNGLHEGWREVTYEGSEEDNGLKASYYTMTVN